MEGGKTGGSLHLGPRRNGPDATVTTTVTGRGFPDAQRGTVGHPAGVTIAVWRTQHTQPRRVRETSTPTGKIRFSGTGLTSVLRHPSEPIYSRGAQVRSGVVRSPMSSPILVYASLATSLFAAFLAILGKQRINPAGTMVVLPKN